MEIIQLAGYTEEEKFFIAKRYLVPKQTVENGLKARTDRLHRKRNENRDLAVHPGSGPQKPRAQRGNRLPQNRSDGG